MHGSALSYAADNHQKCSVACLSGVRIMRQVGSLLLEHFGICGSAGGPDGSACCLVTRIGAYALRSA